ncbi:hypothetical protein [Sanguibacter sp. 25GB23B1]|uniref:hypothetical protein n=1 Tax=unclassified Sanguibacter TaxID=2645534 RepID=UPI0032AFB8B0
MKHPDDGTDSWPQTWDEWSRRDRDERERAALTISILGRRAQTGHAHEAAVRAYRAARRTTTLATAALAIPLVTGWILVIRARDASIEAGFGDRSFAPAGFALLVLTAALTLVILRWWRRVVRARPDALHLEVHPDSPDAPRHPTFDGTGTPPRRW